MTEFETIANELTEKNNNVLATLDAFEEKIKVLNDLTKQYNEIKKQIKSAMLKIANENNLEQVKWVTPKDIKITLSVGKEPEFERVTKKELNQEKLQKEYPNVYEECLEDKEIVETISNGSSDRLVITLPKE